jgi:hypothetical protein
MELLISRSFPRLGSRSRPKKPEPTRFKKIGVSRPEPEPLVRVEGA